MADRYDPGFDPDALRARYRAERDKGLREHGNAQYVEIKGDLKHYIDDPYLAGWIERARPAGALG